ncbi:P-loop NTPase family protein [Alicyclobacillus mengziensis]|uniref:AAA domain-containing protein n=1 Tax=Alicyclobacillus mengziensis TaxID=2931921 RepID=A0A9X7W428_9BACL|nr:hypothetical protein [Alicyclobacillus mengziensis]QSO50137.1 hypothetical protein JZ786_24535 [Alicyclobacillus mengziensis]
MYSVKLRETLLKSLQTTFDMQDIDVLTDVPPGQELVLVDGLHVSHTDILDYRVTQSRELHYIVDEITPAEQSFAAINNLILHLASDVQIYLVEKYSNTGKKPVLAFWGVLPQVGTTTLAVSTAQLLAQRYELSILVLSLNLYDPGDWIAHKATYYLDDLKSELHLRSLTPERLRSMTDELGGVRILYGNRNPLYPYQYTDVEIRHLIRSAKEAFDVVICDIGSYLNTAGALVALEEATQTYAIMPDRGYAQRRFHQVEANILRTMRMNPRDMLLIGNKMDNPSLKTLSIHADAMQATPLVAIGNYAAVTMRAQTQPEPLKMLLDERKYRTDIQKIVEGFSKTYLFSAGEAAATKR